MLEMDGEIDFMPGGKMFVERRSKVYSSLLEDFPVINQNL